MKRILSASFFCGWLTFVSIGFAATDVVGVGSGAKGIEGFGLVPTGGVTASLRVVEKADGPAPALVVRFRKKADVRRMVALAIPRKTIPEDAKVLELRCRVTLRQGHAPRPALILFEEDGGVWFKVGGNTLPADKFGLARVPLSFREASFSEGKDHRLDRAHLRKLWLGFVFDGPAVGEIALSKAVLTSAPYRATSPLVVTGKDPGHWTVAKDSAVRCNLTTTSKAPKGRPCMRIDFTFPLGRHMYMLPQVRVPSGDLEGYSALRFVYKAQLPKGIDGLLVLLTERNGAAYFADPPPAPTKEWKTVTIPFSSFKLGGWSHDANHRLDPDEIASVAIGAHGTATGDGGRGTIWAADVMFVP